MLYPLGSLFSYCNSFLRGVKQLQKPLCRRASSRTRQGLPFHPSRSPFYHCCAPGPGGLSVPKSVLFCQRPSGLWSWISYVEGEPHAGRSEAGAQRVRLRPLLGPGPALLPGPVPTPPLPINVPTLRAHKSSLESALGDPI